MQPLTRITIPISVEEREALRTLALNEMRDPREHVRLILRRELTRKRLLPTCENNSGQVIKSRSAAIHS